MLTNPQKSLLKRAQREAGLSDDEYREALQMVTGYRTSTAPDFTQRHMDTVLAYFEAIHWRGVDAGTLQRSGSPIAVFRQRRYWADKNAGGETSRDRYNQRHQGGDIAALEAQMARLGYGREYCLAIRKNVCKGREDAHALYLYKASLQRTLKAKAKARRENRDHIPF